LRLGTSSRLFVLRTPVMAFSAADLQVSLVCCTNPIAHFQCRGNTAGRALLIHSLLFKTLLPPNLVPNLSRYWIQSRTRPFPLLPLLPLLLNQLPTRHGALLMVLVSNRSSLKPQSLPTRSLCRRWSCRLQGMASQ